jgi:ABC-type amino acid transport substrate-binding protein
VVDEKRMHLWKKLCLAGAISAAIVSSPRADSLEAIKLRGKLLVGVSETTPPFSFRSSGESIITGYDIDLVRAVTKRIGLAIEMAPLSSAERIPSLQQGKVDLRCHLDDANARARTRHRLQLHLFRYAARGHRNKVQWHHFGAPIGWA